MLKQLSISYLAPPESKLRWMQFPIIEVESLFSSVQLSKSFQISHYLNYNSNFMPLSFCLTTLKKNLPKNHTFQWNQSVDSQSPVRLTDSEISWRVTINLLLPLMIMMTYVSLWKVLHSEKLHYKQMEVEF